MAVVVDNVELDNVELDNRVWEVVLLVRNEDGVRVVEVLELLE